MTSTLVSFNIVCDNTLMNRENNVPILFSYEGDYDSIIESLINNESFIEHIISKCFNKYDYVKSKLCYCFFDNSNNDEYYRENIVNIQDIFPIEMINDRFSNYINGIFWKEILLNHIHIIYKLNMNKTFINNEIISMDDEIKMMIDDMMKNDNVSYKTICQYLRADLNSTSKLSEENVNFLIKYLENLNTNN